MLYFVVRLLCLRKESLRSLSHHSPDEFFVLVLLLLLPSLLGNVVYAKKNNYRVFFSQLAPKQLNWNALCVARGLPFTTLH